MKDFNSQHVKNAFEVIRAINNPTRIKLLDIINSEPGHFVAELYKEKIKLDQSVCSQHLGILRRAKIITYVKKGKEVYYSINEPYVAALQSLLKELSEL